MNPAQTHRRPFWRTPKQRAVFIAALVFGAGALLWVLSRGDTFNGDSGLVFIAPLVTALVAGAAWWLMLRLDPQITVWRSAVVGAVIGLAVHPPIWYLEIVFHDWSNTPLQALGDLMLALALRQQLDDLALAGGKLLGALQQAHDERSVLRLGLVNDGEFFRVGFFGDELRFARLVFGE